MQWNILNYKKEKNNAICSNMNATRDSHTEWSKSKRERQISYDITFMWNLKYGTNDPICKTETDHRHPDHTCVFWGRRAGWGGGREGDRGEFGVKTITFKMDKQGVLLHSIGNHVQFLGLEHDGRQYKTMHVLYIYVCDWVTMLYSRNWHNAINQLYCNKKKIKFKKILSPPWLLLNVYLPPITSPLNSGLS